MATGITETSNYGSMSSAWAHRSLLQRPKPDLVFNLFGNSFVLPQKSTQTMVMRRQENINSDPVVLPEGADPAPEQVQKFDISVTPQEFGKVVLLSRKVLLVVEDDTARQTADNLGQAMHTMMNKVTRDVWSSSVAQLSCLNGSNGNAITELTQDDVDRGIAYLELNDTEKMTPTIEGSSQFGTGPVESSFWCVAHKKVKPDIRSLDSFEPTSRYGSQKNVLTAELGATEELRWVTSTLATVTSDSPPVYHNTMVGANAYGYVSIDGVSTETIFKPLGFNDNLNRFQSMGFTAFFNAVILDESHIVTLLSTKK